MTAASAGGAFDGRSWAGTTELDAVCKYGNVRDLTAGAAFNQSDLHPCEDHAAALAPVGSYRDNGWGFQDMTGNAAEWLWGIRAEDRMVAASAGNTGPGITMISTVGFLAPTSRVAFLGLRLGRAGG